MKNSLLCICSFCLAASLFVSCSDNKDWSGGLKSSDLVFQTYLPSQGGRGTELSIRGNNFGDDLSQVQVWVNEKEAKVTQVTPTRIYAQVAEASGSGIVKVRVGDTEYSYPDKFTFNFSYKVHTVAGNGETATIDGALANAAVHWPIQLAYDKKDDAVFILQDDAQHRIRRIKNGEMTTLCDPTSILNNPRSICFSLTGDTLFIGNDNGNNPANTTAVAILLRKDDFKEIKPYIPSGKYPQPSINGIAVNPADGSLFSYHWPCWIYRWNKESETVEEILDRSTLRELTFNIEVTDDAGNPHMITGDGAYASLAFSPNGKTLYWVGRDPYLGILQADYDLTTHKLGELSPFAGNGSWGVKDGQGMDARLDGPNQVAVDEQGNLYVAVRFGQAIRKITPEGYVSTYAGRGGERGYIDGEASIARFSEPHGVVVDNQGNVYVSDCGVNQRIRIIKPE